MSVALLLVGIVLSLSASLNYIIATLHGTVKPNRVSWLMWTFAAGAGGWVTLRAGGDILVVIRIALAVIVPFVVFITSFWGKNGYWRMSQFDFSCGVLSFVAIACWLLYSNAPLSITLAGLADLLAGCLAGGLVAHDAPWRAEPAPRMTSTRSPWVEPGARIRL